MALDSIPPWLNIGPQDYLHAIQAGTQSGLEAARMRAAAQEAAARTQLAREEAARSSWEFNERMRQQAQLAAMENERQAQYQSGMLDWHREQMRMDAEKAAMGDKEAQARLAETARHNLATEALTQARNERDMTPSEVNLDPNKYYVTAGGAVVQPRRDTSQITPSAALRATINPTDWAFAQSQYGPDATNLLNIAKSGFMPKPSTAPNAGTVPQELTDDEFRAQFLKPSSAKEVIRYTKDGRAAVFDANTKEFLRYAD